MDGADFVQLCGVTERQGSELLVEDALLRRGEKSKSSTKKKLMPAGPPGSKAPSCPVPGTGS